MPFALPHHPSKEANPPQTAFPLLVAGLMALLLGVHFYLALTPANSFLDWFHFDDAFYYFKTAQNIVAGHGVTFDGTGPTNGFHPLWMLLLLPLFAVSHGDGILALRLALVLVGLLLAVAVGLFYREGRHHFGPAAPLLVVALGVLWPPAYLTLAAGGVESALSVLTLVGFWAALAWVERTGREADPKAMAAVGATAACAMLARLDNALVVAVVGLLLLVRWGRADLSWRRRLRLALAYGVPGLFGVGSFLLWSRLYVGTWLPISAQVKTWWGALPNMPYPRAWRYRLLGFVAHFRNVPMAQWPEVWKTYLAVPRYQALLVLGSVALAALLLGAFFWWRKGRTLWPAIPKASLTFFGAGVVFHYIYMKFFSGMSPLRDWYWTPEIVGLAVLGAFLLGGLWRRWSRGSLAPRVWFWALVLVVLGAGGYFARWAYEAYPWQNDHLHPYLFQAQWVEAHTEPGAVIGATGAGALGYFVQGRQVINLDGLISTPAYFHALREGRGVAYLQAHGVRYVFGGFWLTKFNPYREMFANRLDTVAKFRYDDIDGTLFRFLP